MKRKVKILSLLLIIAFVFNILAPTMKVVATVPGDTSGYALIEIGGGANSITDANNDTTVTLTYTEGTVTVSGEGLYSSTSINGNGNYEIYGLGDVTITATANENYTADLRENG